MQQRHLSKGNHHLKQNFRLETFSTSILQNSHYKKTNKSRILQYILTLEALGPLKMLGRITINFKPAKALTTWNKLITVLAHEFYLLGLREKSPKLSLLDNAFFCQLFKPKSILSTLQSPPFTWTCLIFFLNTKDDYFCLIA